MDANDTSSEKTEKSKYILCSKCFATTNIPVLNLGCQLTHTDLYNGQEKAACEHFIQNS